MTGQSTRHILLIEPAEFYANSETMETNVYQHDEHEPHAATGKKALAEFRAFRDALVEAGIFVTVARGAPGNPDQLFPNWASTHAGGQLILYPMLNNSRRRERTSDMIGLFTQHYDVLHDLRDWEKDGKFIEATGSLVLDRVNRIVYAGLSRRTSRAAVEGWAKLMGWRAEIFDSRSHTDLPVYHTDLLIWIGTDVCAVAAENIVPEDRARIVDSLKAHRDVIELTREQQQAFCGNSLEVMGENNERMLVMSQSARDALSPAQVKQLQKYFTRLVAAPLTTIETYGGGSARCLMQEMF